MSILEKLNIKDLSDTKLRDEILRTEEQIKILKLTEKEYQGYLRMLEAEREKRQIGKPDYLHGYGRYWNANKTHRETGRFKELWMGV